MLEEAQSHDPETTKQIRKLETALARERSLRRSAERKHQQVENELAAALARQEFWDALERDLNPQPLVVRSLKSSAPATAWLLCSDWHVEQKIVPTKINGLNEHNLEICKRRANHLFPRWLYLVDSARRISKIKDAKLWLGGDFIAGYLHDELVESNLLSPTEASLFAEDLLIDGINHILKYGKFDSVEIICNWGNHGRTTAKKRISTAAQNSYEWLMYKHLERMFRKVPKVRFTIAEGEQVIVECQGYKVRCQHGDAIKYGGGVGGLTIPLSKAIAQWNKGIRCDFDIMGHWHQWLPNYWFMVNMAQVGYDEFAQHIKAECQPPAQGLLVVDRDRGVVDQRRVYVEGPRRLAAA